MFRSSFYVLFPTERLSMQLKKSKKLYNVEVELRGGLTKHVKVKAIDRETANNRALKFQPHAIGIKQPHE